MNLNFGRLGSNGKLEYADNFVKINGVIIVNPTDDEYKACGWFKIFDKKPPVKDGFEIVFDKYVVNKINKYIAVIYVYKPIAKTRKISKIYLKITLIKMNLIDRFNEWLEAITIDVGEGKTISGTDAWKDCLVLDEGDPVFAQYLNMAKEFFGPDLYEKIVSQCIAKE